MPAPAVIVLGTSFSSVPLYHELRSAGFYLISCGGKKGDIGHRISDEQAYIDYSEPEAVIEYILSYRKAEIFIVPSSNDIAYKTACLARERLCIDGGVSWDLASKVHEKDKFKTLLEELRIPTPRVFRDQALNPFEEIEVAIVKPIDSFSGIGISVCGSYPELERAKLNASKHSTSGEVIVEQFIRGSLHSCSAFISDGKIKESFFADEFCYKNRFQVSGSNFPSNLPDEIRKLVEASILKVIDYLEYKNGLFHVQLMVERGIPYLIEAMLRCPGDLFPELVRFANGVNYTYLYMMSFVPGLPEPSRVSVDSAPEGSFIWRETLADEKNWVYCGFENIYEENTILACHSLSSIGDDLRPAPKDKAGIILSRTNSVGLSKIISNKGAYELY